MIDDILKGFEVWTDAQSIKSGMRAKNIENISMEGVKSLRQLILGLSLAGHFSSNESILSDSIDKDIKEARTKYFEIINKKDKQVEYSEPLITEFELRKSWRWKRIGEICDLQTGATPSTLNPNYYGGKIKWLVSGDINQGIIEDCEGRITEEGLKNSNCKILPVNTVLIALNGQGKTRASVALLKTQAACNQSLVGIIPFSETIIDSSFIQLALKYRYYEIRDITGQNQRRGLNMGLISELSVPLPPIEEQKRIVEKVTKLMILCDKLEEKQKKNLDTHQQLVKSILQVLIKAKDSCELQRAWERISKHFDTLFFTNSSLEQLKKAILELAIMGKLVRQNSNDETADIVLMKINGAKNNLIESGVIKKQKELDKIKKEEIPFLLPPGWIFERLNNVIDVRDGTHDSPRDAIGNNTYPLVTSKDFKDGKINFDNARRISENDHLAISKRSKVEKYDILFSMIGGNLGNQVMVLDETEFSIKNVALIKYYNKHLTLPFFIKKYTEYLAFDLQSRAIGGAQPFVSLGLLRNLIIGLPPVEEQKRILMKVEELFSICDKLKDRISNSDSLKNLLSNTVIEFNK